MHINKPVRCGRRAVLIATTALLFAVAGVARAMDLSESVSKAEHYDPSLQASNYAKKAGQEKRNQATALYLPQISLGGEYQRVWARTNVNVPPNFPYQVLAPLSSAGNVYGYGVTLKQPLYSADVSVKATQLRDQAKLSGVNNQRAQQELIVRVSEAYFNVIVAEDTLRYTLAEKAAVSQQLASAQARFKAGRTNITDVQDAQARYDAILAEELSAENNLSQWRVRYERSVGAAPENLVRLSDSFQPTQPDPDNVNEWIRRGDAGNLDLESKLIQQNIADKAIDLYTLSSRPQLDLFASYSDMHQNGTLSFIFAPDRRRSAAIGIQLSIPLFTGGALESQLREARATSEQASYEVKAERSNVAVQVREAFQDVETGVLRIKALEQASVAAKTALDANELALKVGSKDTQDVLNAEQTYYQTLKELDQARYQYLMSQIMLELATGRLNDAFIAQLNAQLHRV